MKPTALGFSAVDAGSERQCRSSTATHSPTRPAQYSTRSLASGAACGLRRAPPRGSPSRRSSRYRATRHSPWPTSTIIRQRLSARPRWRGRRPRCSCTIWPLILMRPISSRSSPARSCTRTLRCGLHPRCSHAIPGGRRHSGGTEFPATYPLF
jgi:hypothetical protein